MTFVQARNAIIEGLFSHVGRPVGLSDQIADVPEYPYGYYSVLAPRISHHTFGLQKIEVRKEGTFRVRSEPVEATLSFTFCGQNRYAEDGVTYIYGDNEALELAEKAHGFFLLNGHNISTVNGDVVVKNVGSVSNRTGFLVEDAVRRYGFDVLIAFIRTDEMETTTVKSTHEIGNLHQ